MGALRKAWLLATRNEMMTKRHHARTIILDRSDFRAALRYASVQSTYRTARPIRAPRSRAVRDRAIALIDTRGKRARGGRKEGKRERKEEGKGPRYPGSKSERTPLLLSCTRRGAPRERLGFADFSDRLASSELLVFLPRVS